MMTLLHFAFLAATFAAAPGTFGGAAIAEFRRDDSRASHTASIAAEAEAFVTPRHITGRSGSQL
jgi:hypothetical protein